MFMKSRLRISTQALKHFFCIEHNALTLLLFAFHHLKDSTNPRVCWELLDRSCRGRWQWGREGGSLAAFHCSAQAGKATLTTAKGISRCHKHSFQQPCLDLFSTRGAGEHKSQFRVKAQTCCSHPPTDKGVPSGQLCELGNSFAKEMSQCLLALRAE